MLHEGLGPTDVDELGELAISQAIQLVEVRAPPSDDLQSSRWTPSVLVTPDLLDGQHREPARDP